MKLSAPPHTFYSTEGANSIRKDNGTNRVTHNIFWGFSDCFVLLYVSLLIVAMNNVLLNVLRHLFTFKLNDNTKMIRCTDLNLSRRTIE